MGHVVTFPADRHREVQLLLPWYGAGTLDEADRALVEGGNLTRILGLTERAR